MRNRLRTKFVVAFAAIVSLPLSSLLAQDLPKSGDESFDVEPPLLIPPSEPERASDDSDEDAPEPELDAGKLVKLVEIAKKNAAAAKRLVKNGVLSKVEAELRALRVVRLESELAKAQMLAADEQVTAQKSRLAAGQATQADVDLATAAFTHAQAAAQAAEDSYHKAQLENAALNLSRQRKLFKLGSAHKSDVAGAEEKRAKRQQNGNQGAP